MRSNKTLKRLVGGFGLMVAVAATVVLASTSAFAFNTATDTRDTTNGVATANGTVSVATLNVASTARVVASFTANNVLASAPAGSAQGVASPYTNIRTMYQQWRQTQQNDWFYVYAQNSGTSLTTANWDYYYYTPARGYTRLNVASAGANGTTLASSSLVATYVYLTTGTNVPAFWVENVGASASTCNVAGASSCNGNNFTVELGWGLGMQGFRNEGGTGTVALQQAAETFPYPAGGVGSSRVFYDGWVPVNTGQPTITLGNNAPTQSATGVTNASGARNVNTATSYSSVQTVADVDGDLSSASLIWVFTSGTQTGQWFQAGVYNQRSSSGYRLSGAVTAFYQSWNEAVTYTTSGAQLTTNYFTTLTVSSSPTTADRGNGEVGITSQSVTYSYVYSNLARGNATLYGRGEDFHGRTSGNVQVGTQTIS